MKLPIKYIVLVALLFSLINLACKHSTMQSAPAQDCTTFINDAEQKIKDNDNDSLLSKDLQRIYFSTPLSCRYAAGNIIFRNLFLLAYKKPYLDSTILPFLIQQGENDSVDTKTKLIAYFNEASYHLYILHDPESGYNVLEKAKKYESQFNDTLAKSYATVMAQCMLQKGDLKSSAAYYLKAIEYNEKLKDSNSLMGNIGNLAVVYSEMGEFKKSIPLRKKSIQYYESQGNDLFVFIGLTGLASTYGNLGVADSALPINYKAIDLLKKGVINPVNEFIIYINLGQIYLNQNKIDSSIHYFDKAKTVMNKIGGEERKMNFIVYSTQAYASRRDVSKEVEQMKNYSQELFEKNDLISARDTWYTLHKIAQLQKKPKETLETYLIYDSINNILTSNANKNFINELQTKFETQKKETQIQLQQKKINKNQSLIIALIGFHIAGFLGTFLIINRFRLKRNRQKILQQQHFASQFIEKTEEERARIARDLHDVLSQELLLLKNKLLSNQKITPNNIDSLIQEVETVSKNIHTDILQEVGFKKSVVSLCQRIMKDSSLDIICDISYNDFLSHEDELQLYRIIQEGLNNIVKYAKADKVKVSIFPKEDFLVVHIQDNGIGFDVEETLANPTSFGILGIYARSSAINGNAEIQSSKKGTIIKIEIAKRHV